MARADWSAPGTEQLSVNSEQSTVNSDMKLILLANLTKERGMMKLILYKLYLTNSKMH